MRKRIVAGNWKMNLNRIEADALARDVVALGVKEAPADVTLIMCVPSVHLSTVEALLPAGQRIAMGAQNCSEHEKGAYTGEISVDMLSSYNTSYVILGHSERREYFAESNELLAKKVDLVLSKDMKAIFCCGETKEERESSIQEKVVRQQLEEGLFHLSEEQMKEVVIAYEPVWAIGTGLTATSEQAQEIHAFIRKLVSEKYGEEVANSTSILYGGSCKPGNAAELFACPDVDGGLIGGASLKAADFVAIAKSYPKA